METLPAKLFEGAEGEKERAARMGRFLILEECGYFGTPTNVALAMGDYKGSFAAAVRRRFSNIYGNSDGCSAADLEVAAELLGVFEAVYETELERPEQ